MDWKPISGCFEAGGEITTPPLSFYQDMFLLTFQKPALKRIEFPRSLERKDSAVDLAISKISRTFLYLPYRTRERIVGH